MKLASRRSRPTDLPRGCPVAVVRRAGEVRHRPSQGDGGEGGDARSLQRAPRWRGRRSCGWRRETSAAPGARRRKRWKRAPGESRALRFSGSSNWHSTARRRRRSTSSARPRPTRRFPWAASAWHREDPPGKVDAGREELQAATALDPDDSLLRSYLGKALYEEKRHGGRGEGIRRGQGARSNDLPRGLYDAILKQTTTARWRPWRTCTSRSG